MNPFQARHSIFLKLPLEQIYVTLDANFNKSILQKWTHVVHVSAER